jgi:hypothetical protein
MGTFTTKLKLGGEAFGVSGGLDPTIQRLTVGQIRVIETLPGARFFTEEPCYKEEYMCVETGVGSGTIWTYGKNIFATDADAHAGVIAHQQAAYKQRAERDALREQEAERQRLSDLRTLERLKKQYEAASGLVDA